MNNRPVIEATSYSASVVGYVDHKTGVEYLVFSGYNGVAVTPRLNSDGSLHIRRNENDA